MTQPNTPIEIEAMMRSYGSIVQITPDPASEVVVYQDWEVRHMLTSLNASRMAEVVSIAEGMKQISVVVPHHNPYLSGYNQALNELITALSPDDTIKS
jgi:hypothetical protein